MPQSNTWRVLCTYPSIRWYILTCVCKDAGDWLVRIANLLVVQEWAGTGTALSQLVICSLIPKAFLAPIGGILADRYDRRHLMILLDAMAGIVVLGFLIAAHYKSVEILFVVTALRSAISAVYYPVTYGLLPLMVPNNQDLQYAGSIATSVYGLMSMFGGLIAGSSVVMIGMSGCYAIDSVTYFISSFVMLFFVKGSFKVRQGRSDDGGDMTIDTADDTAADAAQDHKCCRCCGTSSSCTKCLDILLCGTRNTFNYLCGCGCGMLIFMKATDSLIWGPGDVIGVEVSTVRNADGSEDDELTSYRMGLYYCFSGLGVFLGPTLANWFSDAQRPSSLQRSCCLAIFVAMTGWIMAAFAPTYNFFLLSQWWSGLGYGTLWAYSSLLLQLLVDRSMLGRVLSIEYFFYVIAESLSSSVTGPLYDRGHTTAELCMFGAALALFSFLFWTTYHLCGLGASRAEFNGDNASQASVSDSVKDSDIPVTIETMSKKKQNGGSGGGRSGTSSSVFRRKSKLDKEIPTNARNIINAPIPSIIGFNQSSDDGAASTMETRQKAPGPLDFVKEEKV
mmetsp:Transcript_12449/g.16369  ORF Transcript_12449/g.16369 Transcript_12449/m.16369 type:complete len:563 (-) Transcript_12449:188-1876(-)|eukprot:CAMPEP_0198148034 /NCGR_PEP_ID=MMETSP1443-20131203/39331_1 /TAXON_ID=186043 /ORGANISM="Entomoneis sp., Strain CCMP2396" /LENGTH=562 /DNA_ID=CAMNT_0043812595 /DNA_START=135 /DNA_END=1823 /DNA_ORIENTATION=+